MTWFGAVSAWAALLMGALFGVNAYFQFATGVNAWEFVAIAAMLLLGGFRTLRKMSGGLRLLSGAWGVAIGLLPLTIAQATQSVWERMGLVEWVLLGVATIGLALAVLHKETKA